MSDWLSRKIGAVLTVVILLATDALCDDRLGWIREAQDCAAFGQGIVEFHKSIAQKASLSEEDRNSLQLVMQEACSPRFIKCGYGACDEQVAQTPQPLPDLPAGVPEPVNPPLRNVELKPAIVTDPLAWLNGPLECGDLVDQIKARYLPLGSYSELPLEKRRELDKILDVVCGERFAHCSFPSCPAKDSAVSTGSSTKRKAASAKVATAAAVNALLDESTASLAKLKQEAEVKVVMKRGQIAALQLAIMQERQAQIESAVAEEQAKGAVWRVFSIPDGSESATSDEDQETDFSAVNKKKSQTDPERSNFEAKSGSAATRTKSGSASSRPAKALSSGKNQSRKTESKKAQSKDNHADDTGKDRDSSSHRSTGGSPQRLL